MLDRGPPRWGVGRRGSDDDGPDQHVRDPPSAPNGPLPRGRALPLPPRVARDHLHDRPLGLDPNLRAGLPPVGPPSLNVRGEAGQEALRAPPHPRWHHFVHPVRAGLERSRGQAEERGRGHVRVPGQSDVALPPIRARGPH